MAEENEYATPKAFLDLYYSFTGNADPSDPAKSNIGSMLSDAVQRNEVGPLILATPTGLYVYDSHSRKRIGGAIYRAGPQSGFFEATAVSHIGPAVAYLAQLHTTTGQPWRPALEEILDHIRTVRELNANSENHWLDRINLEPWAPHHEAIRNLFDYACAYSGNYITSVLAGAEFSPRSVQENFFSGISADFPIPFNAVMIGTFALVGLEGIHRIQQALSSAAIDWPRAMVILQNCAGHNYSAALTRETNSIYDLLVLLSNHSLPEDRILIVPYAGIRSTVGSDTLSEEDFNYYVRDVWAMLYGQAKLPAEVFSNIESIPVPERPSLPGDYDVTPAHKIEDFMRRLKHSLEDNREAQSNTILFWLGREMHSKHWDPAAVDLPGVNIGFPDGVSGYPATSRIIP